MNSYIKLVSVTATTNKAGDPIETETEREVIAEIKSISQGEFYQAGATGFKPEIKFILWNFEYEGESSVIYEGEKYKIIRTYDTGEKIELTCQRGVNPGGT